MVGEEGTKGASRVNQESGDVIILATSVRGTPVNFRTPLLKEVLVGGARKWTSPYSLVLTVKKASFQVVSDVH